MTKIQRTIAQILLYALFLIASYQVGQAQGDVTLSVQVDPKITVAGDPDHDVKAGLYNMLIKSRWQGNQQKYGYLYVAPAFEYAQLSEDYPEYYRTTFELGYTLNQFSIEGLELTLYADYGFIDRGLAKMSYGFGGVIGYKVTDRIRLIATLQYADRSDFEILYNLPSELRYSVQGGVEIVVFRDYRKKNLNSRFN